MKMLFWNRISLLLCGISVLGAGDALVVAVSSMEGRCRLGLSRKSWRSNRRVPPVLRLSLARRSSLLPRTVFRPAEKSSSPLRVRTTKLR